MPWDPPLDLCARLWSGGAGLKPVVLAICQGGLGNITTMVIKPLSNFEAARGCL
jgi:hypothetical protein